MRKPRADAERNRQRLIEVAKVVFTDAGSDASLEEIARRAGFGIATLYRHFPMRSHLLEAVYRRDVEHLADAATRLTNTTTPVVALRDWMRLFIDYIATKKIVAPALSALTDGATELFACSRAQISDAIAALVDHGVVLGEIRPGVDPMDLLYALVGFTNTNIPQWEDVACRLIDMLIDGLKMPADAASGRTAVVRSVRG